MQAAGAKPAGPLDFGKSVGSSVLDGPFFALQYRREDGSYYRGPDDVYIILTLTAGFLILRQLLFVGVLAPLCRSLLRRKYGSVKAIKVLKFQEAGFFAIYYAFSWTWGYLIIRQEEFYFDADKLWLGYPHTQLRGDFKLFYVVQLSFWISALVVLFIEKKRKDFVEMMVHHLLTIAMVAFSLATNFTRIGLAVLVEQDLADILLYIAKCLSYVGAEPYATGVFASFALAWVGTRHVILPAIIYSIYNKEFTQVWDPSVGNFMTPNARIGWLAALNLLHVLLLFWLYLIIKLIIKQLSPGASAVKDSRSDSEEEDEKKD